jgi:hypothetical protein
MLEQRVHALLKRIADATYPGKIRPFFVELCARELRGRHADYKSSERLLRIFNLSQPTPFLVASGIHELAHHSEFCLHGKTGHSARFYETMFALLKTAIEMGIIEHADALDSGRRSADLPQLRKRFGDQLAALTSLEAGDGALLVKVTNAYAIKDTLKDRGYRFSNLEAAWCKEIPQSDEQAERQFLNSVHRADSIAIVAAHKADIEAIYHLVVKGGFDQREQLKAAGYLFNGYGRTGKVWVKRIAAQTLPEEKERLEGIGIAGGDYKVEGRTTGDSARRTVRAGERRPAGR